MKPLIVGEAPSKNEVTERPIEGRVGRRLADCCCISLDEFLHRFDRVNLLHVRQDTKEKGFEFDEAAASQEAHRMATTLDFNDRPFVLLLGKRVAAAFGAHANYFEAQHVGTRTTLYVLPHPSGVNRWWNDPENHRKICDFMQYLLAALDNEMEPV